jgi:hypothetical protein
MDFLDMKLHLNLYSPDAFIRASQHQCMALFDQVAQNLYLVIMQRGSQTPALRQLLFAFSKLDLMVQQSKTRYLLDSPTYQMCDLYGFPHVSRIFYL